MASKASFFFLSIFLLITSEVTSTDESKMKGAPYAKPPVSAPATSPSKPPATAPVVPTPPTMAPPPMAPVSPPTASPMPPVRSKADCIPLCEKRCSLHSRKRVCMRACTTCCVRCKCVPPGTYGNREKCGKCYTDMTTHGHKLKCP